MRRSTGIAILRAKTTLVNLSHILHLYLARFAPVPAPPKTQRLPESSARQNVAGILVALYQRQLAHAAAAIRNGDIMLPVIIGIVVVIVIACAIAGIYNNMVTKRNRIDNAWQNIDTQLQRRNDLIPNLVETVKGYAKHEQETLSAVISARNTAVKATTPEAKMEADNVLTGALRQLFAVAEAYPDLKANTNFTQLQASLEDTENKISYARQSYNDCVLSYNNAIQTFPAVIFAGIFQFKERQGFEAAEAARQAPTVKF